MKRVSLSLMAVLAVTMVALGVAFFPHLVSSAADALPLMLLANAPAGLDVKQLVDGIAAGMDELKRSHATGMRQLRADFDRLEAKGNRAGLGDVAGDGSAADRSQRATPELRKDFAEKLRRMDVTDLAGQKDVMVGGGNPNLGGNAVPTWFDSEITQAVREGFPLTGLVSWVRVGNFPARRLVNLGTQSVGWVGETSSRPKTEPPKIEKLDLVGEDLYAMVYATQWALDDMAFDVEAWLRAEVARGMGSSIEAAIVSGDAPNGMRGITTYPTAQQDDAARPWGTIQAVHTGGAGLYASEPAEISTLLVNVIHKLRPAYRSRAHWVMSSNTLAAMRTLKDAAGRPILIDPTVQGAPPLLMGYPVAESEAMPEVAANGIPVAFGDFQRGYLAAEHVAGLRIIVDQVTNKPSVGFYCLRRLAGGVPDTNAIKLVKCAA